MKTVDAYHTLSALIPSLMVVAETLTEPAASNLKGGAMECIMASGKPSEQSPREQSRRAAAERGQWESVARLTIGKPPRAPRV